MRKDMNASGSSVRGKRPAKNAAASKKKGMATDSDEMLAEYDLSKMKGGVRGKYFHRMWADHGLRRLNPDLAKAFPDDESVNRALRLLVEATTSLGKRSKVA